MNTNFLKFCKAVGLISSGLGALAAGYTLTTLRPSDGYYSNGSEVVGFLMLIFLFSFGCTFWALYNYKVTSADEEELEKQNRILELQMKNEEMRKTKQLTN
jgi:hypothetical protein